MANTKISQLPSATTPVAGTEVLPIVQSSTTSKVSIANLTAGRAVSASSYDATGATAPANGMFSLAAGSLAFSVASSQIGKFLSGGGGGAFEVDDAASAGYDVRRYISVTNLNTGTAASASVYSSAFSTQANLTAFSPSHATTALANKSVLFGSNRGSNASSGTVVADFSTGTNQIQFYLGTTASPLSVAHFLGAAGSFEVSDFAVGAGYNGQRYISVGNASTGTSAYAWTGASALNVNAKLGAFSPSHTSTALANKSVLFGADGASGASGTAIADFSTGTNQIQFYVGTVASPTLAGTVSSTGNWNLYTATLTAGSFTPTSSSFQANSIYYPSTNTISVTNNSAITATFTNLNNFDVGTSNPTNAQRFIQATNVSTGSSAVASLTAKSDVQLAQLQALSSTYPASGSITLAGKALLYAAGGAGSSGLTLWDGSVSPTIQFIVGSTSAGTINSSAVLSLTNNPILTGGTANGVAYLNGSKALTTGSALVFDGTNLGLGTTTTDPYSLGSTGRSLALDSSNASTGSILSLSAGGTRYGYFFANSSNVVLSAYANIPLLFNTNNTTKMTLDSAGNLGLGVTPSAWGSSNKAIDVASYVSFGYRSATNGTVVSNNSYLTSGDVWTYKNNAAASAYQQIGGVHYWSVAASGTASTTITGFNTAAMTLDASGNLLVGATSTWTPPNSTTCRYFATYGVAIGNSTTSASYNNDRITFNAGTYYVLGSSTGGGVKLDNGTTAWAAQSDETTKDIIEPITNATSKVSTLRAVIGKYKEDPEGTRRSFLIAQDVQAVLPEAVSTSSDDLLSLRYTEVIPLLVAAIKELKAEIDALKAA